MRGGKSRQEYLWTEVADESQVNDHYKNGFKKQAQKSINKIFIISKEEQSTSFHYLSPLAWNDDFLYSLAKNDHMNKITSGSQRSMAVSE